MAQKNISQKLKNIAKQIDSGNMDAQKIEKLKNIRDNLSKSGIKLNEKQMNLYNKYSAKLNDLMSNKNVKTNNLVKKDDTTVTTGNAVPVASASDVTTKPAQKKELSSSQISNQLLEAQKRKTIKDLQTTKEKALLQLGTEQQAIAPQYQTMRTQAATQSMQQARNFGEYMAARGQTTSGLAAQAELTRGAGLTRQLGEIGQQQQAAQDALNARKSQIAVDFQSQISNAKSAFEIQKLQQQYQNAITQEDRIYNEKLIKQGQQFQAGEAEKGRIFAAEQDQIARDFSAEQALKAQEFTKIMTKEEQDFLKSQKAEDRANYLLDLADLREYNEKLTAEERAREDQKTIEQRVWESNERRLDREHDAEQNAIANEIARTNEQISSQQQTDLNLATGDILQKEYTITVPEFKTILGTLPGYTYKPSEEQIATGVVYNDILKNKSSLIEQFGNKGYLEILNTAKEQYDELHEKYSPEKKFDPNVYNSLPPEQKSAYIASFTSQ